MSELIHLDLRINGYLFGSLILLAFWSLTWLALWFTNRHKQIPEFWWASLGCAWLGIAEPLFVPEYWDPPSILKVGRWDLESFLFCFAIGGMSAVVTELPPIKGFFVHLYFSFERVVRSVLLFFSRLTGGRLHVRILDQPPMSRLVPQEQLLVENILLLTFFVGLFGATSHFGVNIIYDVAITCVGTALIIGWRRPNLRWQILGGGISFTLIYTAVLVVMDHVYPGFYDHWNLKELSGIWILGAPAEEYLFSFTFGVLWAPLYEAWKGTRS